MKSKYPRTNKSWENMKRRCKFFPEYAQIDYCERWESFANFLADMGERPAGLTLDRIDGTKGYSPDNCRWASKKEQTQNRAVTRWIEYQGQQWCMTELAELHGLNRGTLACRLKAGWPLEKALTPSRPYRPRQVSSAV